MKLTVKKFDELTAPELYRIMALRVDVFVVEQNCVYRELDGKDFAAIHLWLEQDGELLAYARALAPGVSFEEASIGRVIAAKRRQGLGSRIVAEAIKAARDAFGADRIRIEAQTYAKRLYENLGFRQVSDEFLDDGIPHVEMLWEEK